MSGSDTSGTEMVPCSHCLQKTSRATAIIVEINGESKVFCCKGCLGVYELIHNNSLDAFYNQRCDWQPGPPATEVNLQASAFSDTVTISGNEHRIELLLSGIRCASCVWLIEKFLIKIDGVVSIRVNYATHKATITWNGEKVTIDTILQAFRSIGYLPHPCHGNGTADLFAQEKQDLLLRFGTAGFFSMQLMLFTAALYAGFFEGIEDRYRLAFQLISWALATPVLFYSGYPFLSSALRSLRRMTLNMDVLVALGSLSAYFYSIVMIFYGGEMFFDTASMIITFILLGRFLEAGSRLKAGNAIAELAELQPHEALLISMNGETSMMVPITTLKSGDRIAIIPGDRIPLDGTVVDGEAEVNEAMLTGESNPVFKEPGCKVFAGSFSINGRLSISVSGHAGSTLLAQIIRTVAEAQARKAPIQSIADKTASYFVPATIVLALATFLYWKLTSASTVTALMNSVSVLVIACPCALGLATPLAILVGTTSAGKRGILVKGGDVFESVSKTTTVVLDKTGTITTGKPSITDLNDYGLSPSFMQHVASLESASEHPTGRTIAAAWQGELLTTEQFRAIPGRGVSGVIAETIWRAGSKAFMAEEGVELQAMHESNARLEAEGKTIVMVACGNKLAGIIGMIDDLREDALPLIKVLRNKGLSLKILTGDNQGVADFIAAKCGITDVHAGLGPLEKAAVIHALKQKGECVMMVGDGINDAPALTEADIGVTLGHASGIALESASVAILNDDLRLINTLIQSSSRCFSIIRQNLVWAFSYNLIALPLAVTGVLHPIISALLMVVSSLVVVSNSLRLKKI